jgi:hypothetical protein
LASNNQAKLKRIRRIELLTILASVVGIALPLVHGNIYDYFFNVLSVEQIDLNLRLLYLSLLLYSALALVVFMSFYLHNELNPDLRWYNYVQGWSFIVMAAAGYEWFNSSVIQIVATIEAGTILEDPYTWLTKRYSVIFFGALFVFWFLETRKKRFREPDATSGEVSKTLPERLPSNQMWVFRLRREPLDSKGVWRNSPRLGRYAGIVRFAYAARGSQCIEGY